MKKIIINIVFAFYLFCCYVLGNNLTKPLYYYQGNEDSIIIFYTSLIFILNLILIILFATNKYKKHLGALALLNGFAVFPQLLCIIDFPVLLITNELLFFELTPLGEIASIPFCIASGKDYFPIIKCITVIIFVVSLALFIVIMKKTRKEKSNSI